MSTLAEVKAFQQRERAKRKAGRVPVTRRFKKTNAERAERGGYLIGAYRLKTGELDEPDETTLRDILADLMHMADRDGIDFNAALRMSTIHHQTEAS